MSQAPATASRNPEPARVSIAWRVFTAPTYLGLALIAIHVIDKLWPAAIWFTMPWKMAGWGPILLGCGLCAAGAGHFAKRRTTILPRHDSRVLVTTGVFRWTRNPMYLGMVLILVGVCVIAGSATVWLAPPLFMLVVDRVLIRAEERMLTERFGEAYRAYGQQTRRWL
ncbi:MAG: isoprenylcysteine carboxylmethyltransferase family protein [Planctomycetota bacterium]